MGKYRLELFSYLGFSVELYLNYNNLGAESKKCIPLKPMGSLSLPFCVLESYPGFVMQIHLYFTSTSQQEGLIQSKTSGTWWTAAVHSAMTLQFISLRGSTQSFWILLPFPLPPKMMLGRSVPSLYYKAKYWKKTYARRKS